MSKASSKFICSSCNTVYLAWQGRCSACGEWNSIEEYTEPRSTKDFRLPRPEELFSISLKNSTNAQKSQRLSLSIPTLNTLLGGGIVRGQVILLAGEPGIGKSTLLTQICKNSLITTLYISGEETLEQISDRCLRLGNSEDFASTRFSSDTTIESILGHIQSKAFDLIIIDSIQTVFSSKTSGFFGSLNQMRENGALIIDAAKRSSIAVILISQVTKEGNVAGPKVLEHMVDSVLYFEGSRKNDTRILKVHKNRFGSSSEIAIFRMNKQGLEVLENTDLFFIDELKNEEGVAYSVYNEGNSFFIIEVQALCVKSSFTYPKRVSNGYKTKRLEMLVAILTKKLNLNLEEYDIYINVIGGIKIEDTSADFAVAAAIISSYTNHVFKDKSCFIGEISLTGDIIQVPKQTEKIKKAKKFGFKELYYSPAFTKVNQLLIH